jgi:hypothetical protein
MTTNSTRRFVAQREFHWMPTVVFWLLAVLSFGYIVFMPANVADPEMNEASWFVPSDPATASESASGTPNSQAAGVATARLPSESAAPRNFD